MSGRVGKATHTRAVLLFIGDEQMNDNTFKLVIKEVGHAIKERSVYGLYMAMLEVYGKREAAKPTH